MLDIHYNHKIVEENKYKIWKDKGYFKAKDSAKPSFSMVIPPPNVTGKLHLGHSFNTTIQDIIARYKKAQGFNVLWLCGMDHAGIATQAKVEARLRENNISRYDLGREGFLKAAWSWKDEYADCIHNQWEKMGLMLDYSRERFTLDEGLNEAVNIVFKTLYDEGLIYRGERIINWDPVLKTALSNIEVIHKDIQGSFYYFNYKVVGEDSNLLVATTRPETMFGDVCLNVNPKDKRYQKYIGKTVINPANNEEIPIIADNYVDISFGTGVMKCTPAHDPNDFIIGEKYKLKRIVCMDQEAKMNENAGKYASLDRFECRKRLVEDLKDSGSLVKIESIIHNVGHSERSGAIVEPYLSKQWFVKIRPLADASIKLQESNDKINFHPKRFNKTFIQWMENAEDWCISRQLWWGHRIPAYYHKETGEVLVSLKAPKDIENYYQDEDVLDTWFSSALWPFSTLGWPNNTKDLETFYPLDLMVTAYDIIFFWVARMIFQGLHFTNKAPFKNVLIHGLIRDEQGRKMSKSLGNGIDPIDVIDKYGVDALRYFLATCSTPGLDLRYSEEKVMASANFLNKIWNATRYILMNSEDYVEGEIDIETLNDVDKYILTKLQNTIQNVTKNMDKYELGAASTYLYNFVYNDFCSYYLELSKITLNNKETRSNSLKVLIKVLKAIIMMVYPYSPFVSEELYLALPNHKESIMLESYPKYEKKYVFNEALKNLNLLKDMISDIRNYKVENSMAPNAKVNLVVISSSSLFAEFKELLARFSFAEDVLIKNVAEQDSLATSYIYPNATLLVKDNIDKNELLLKLQKELEKEENEIKRAENLLSNENFLKKAPEAKINIEKSKLAEHKLASKNILEKINLLK